MDLWLSGEQGCYSAADTPAVGNASAAFPEYSILMQTQSRLSETSAAIENRIFFSSGHIKNICDYLNSPTSLVYPQHLANASNTVLNYLLVPSVCVAGPRQS